MNMQDLLKFIRNDVRVRSERVWNGTSYTINYGRGRLVAKPDEITGWEVTDIRSEKDRKFNQISVEGIAKHLATEIYPVKFIHIGKTGFLVVSNGKSIMIMAKDACELIHNEEVAKSVQDCDDSNQDILIDYLSEKSKVVAGMVYEMV